MSLKGVEEDALVPSVGGGHRRREFSSSAHGASLCSGLCDTMTNDKTDSENTMAGDVDAIVAKLRSSGEPTVILEYLDGGTPPRRMYRLGFLNDAEEIEDGEDEIFPELPSGDHPVLKSTGELVSNDEYRKWLATQPDRFAPASSSPVPPERDKTKASADGQ